MDSVQDNLKTSQAAGIDWNLSRLYDEIAGMAGGRQEKNERWSWISVAPGPWPNSVYRVSFSDDSLTGDVKALKAAMLQGGVPRAWRIGPGSTPADKLLGEALRQGFQVVNEFSGMISYLDDEAPADSVSNGPESAATNVIQVEKPDDLTGWCDVVVRSLFGLDGSVVAGFCQLMAALYMSGDIELFAIKQGSRVVATSMLFTSDSWAGMHMVAVTPDWRRQGLGRRVCQAAMEAARNKGCLAMVLHASEMGEPMYRGLGFQEHCRIYTVALPESVRSQ